MEAMWSSKLWGCLLNTWRWNPDDRTIHIHLCMNLRPNICKEMAETICNVFFYVTTRIVRYVGTYVSWDLLTPSSDCHFLSFFNGSGCVDISSPCLFFAWKLSQRKPTKPTARSLKWHGRGSEEIYISLRKFVPHSGTNSKEIWHYAFALL
jgi:hypothetical protein